MGKTKALKLDVADSGVQLTTALKFYSFLNQNKGLQQVEDLL
ncbi:hypothetical protein [Virgibacillus litoralis]|uniref:Uncharacterized protein n=1 Tax=Virgibacillus litoralis TaxID=578221 RepID=A0ABS4HE65_9BACI|nr:hypothetical protein [Virgibacillus litoralis]MBP1948899.1 hypothetical protein [Virgibacillus litoralis]